MKYQYGREHCRKHDLWHRLFCWKCENEKTWKRLLERFC